MIEYGITADLSNQRFERLNKATMGFILIHMFVALIIHFNGCSNIVRSFGCHNH